MRNKKVINATANELDGIAFKSLLERRAYQLFREAGLDPTYELSKVPIMKGFRPQVPFYRHDRKTRHLKLDRGKVLDSTYTPDFVIDGERNRYYVELKGFKTDSYAIKVKLFRKWLETQSNSLFLELHSVRDVREAIGIIKEYEGDSMATGGQDTSINSK